MSLHGSYCLRHRRRCRQLTELVRRQRPRLWSAYRQTCCLQVFGRRPSMARTYRGRIPRPRVKWLSERHSWAQSDLFQASPVRSVMRWPTDWRRRSRSLWLIGHQRKKSKHLVLSTFQIEKSPIGRLSGGAMKSDETGWRFGMLVWCYPENSMERWKPRCARAECLS